MLIMRKSNTVAVFLLPEQALKPQKITQRCYVSLSTSHRFFCLFVFITYLLQDFRTEPR